MNNKKVLALIAIVAIIAIGAYFFPTGRTVVERVTEKLGAVSTLDGVDNPYVSICGKKMYYATIPMAATSTRVCSFRNPFNATSSIVSFSAAITTGITGSNYFDLGTTTVANGLGSSTPVLLSKHYVLSGGQDSVSWVPGTASTTNL